MKTLALALFVAASALSATAAAQAPEAPRVMVIGDSHVERLGPALSRRVEEIGGDALPHLARRGWSSGRYRREGDLRARLREHGAPDVVIVCLGGNDHPYSRAVYERQLSWIVEEARAAGASEILWVGPAATHLGGRASARRVEANIARNVRWQQQILPALGVRWTDSRAFTTDDHARDGLHFNRDGYRHWSEVLVDHWAHDADADARSELLSQLSR